MVHSAPLFIVTDASAAEVRVYMDRLSQMDLGPLENLFLFIMSHGEEGDTIITRDGQYNLFSDVVEKLQDNATLKSVRIFIFVSACRGRHRLIPRNRNAEQKPMMPKCERRISKNLSIFFSTKDKYVSLRDTQNGTLFIDALHKVFGNPFKNIKINELFRQIEDLMCAKMKECNEIILPPDLLIDDANSDLNMGKIVEQKGFSQFIDTVYKGLKLDVNEIEPNTDKES